MNSKHTMFQQNNLHVCSFSAKICILSLWPYAFSLRKHLLHKFHELFFWKRLRFKNITPTKKKKLSSKPNFRVLYFEGNVKTINANHAKTPEKYNLKIPENFVPKFHPPDHHTLTTIHFITFLNQISFLLDVLEENECIHMWNINLDCWMKIQRTPSKDPQTHFSATHAQSLSVIWKRRERMNEIWKFLAQPWQKYSQHMESDYVWVKISRRNRTGEHNQANVYLRINF